MERIKKLFEKGNVLCDNKINYNELQYRRKNMKVLLVNGSPNEQGCTYTALSEIAQTLEQQGIDTEIFHIGKNCYYLFIYIFCTIIIGHCHRFHTNFLPEY